jgi:hypothetical protein
MPRAENPLAVLLWLLARDAVPWGVIEKAVHAAASEVVPELPADDPLAKWAERTAESFQRQS